MTGDERDPAITSVLTSLEAEDPAAAQKADGALQWLTGDYGAEVITQERIQDFLWYELPLKWLMELDYKVAVVQALARALDLLGLSRYATICRSDLTRGILEAYEEDIDKGLAAFRRANVNSGIEPPDLPELEWGPSMGRDEAFALSSTADFLEFAVASGDLVPGARGWKTQQQQLVRSHITMPRIDLVGQTLAQVIVTERIEMWLNTRRSERRRRLLAPMANRLLHPVELPGEGADDPLPPLRWLLEHLADGVGLTQNGNLNRRFVQAAAERFRWDLPRPPRSEEDLHDLHQIRRLIKRLGLARKSGRSLVLTPRGHRLAADPEGLWRATARSLLQGDLFSATAGELALVLLLDVESLPSDQLKATVGQALLEEGFQDARTGEPPEDFEMSWAVQDTLNQCRSLDLLAIGADWQDRSYGLTDIGKATALEALRALATGPRSGLRS